MKPKEYIIWLKGFVEACHEYAPTPKQWDALKDKLAEVDDSIPLGGLISDHNTFGINEVLPRWQELHKVNPFYVGDVPLTNPLGSSGTGTANGVITTTPGQSSITYATPQFVTSTAMGYPSGSNWSYTNSTYNVPYTTAGEDEVIKTHNED